MSLGIEVALLGWLFYGIELVELFGSLLVVLNNFDETLGLWLDG